MATKRIKITEDIAIQRIIKALDDSDGDNLAWIYRRIFGGNAEFDEISQLIEIDDQDNSQKS